MQKIESLQEFYQKLPSVGKVPSVDKAIGHFNVFPRRYCSPSAAYHRRDFYKISLITEGSGIVHFENKDIIIESPVLFFSNPSIAYSWQPTSEVQEGWFCLFTEEFMYSWGHSGAAYDYPISYMDKDPIIFLDKEALDEVSYIYVRMLKEISSDYIYKYNELHNYLQLLIHFAIKHHAGIKHHDRQLDASHRISFRFMDLLETQFPIENTEMPLKLRTVYDFANILSVHENHLNYVVKSVTGKNPSQHITYRVMQEAKALLRNTDWSISDIAYGLSFEYPSHFTAFFKKNTGLTPKQFRQKLNL